MALESLTNYLSGKEPVQRVDLNPAFKGYARAVKGGPVSFIKTLNTPIKEDKQCTTSTTT